MAKKEIPTEHKISLEEALKACDNCSCGYCSFCLDKKQDKYIDRNDGVRSYKPWRGTCYRYPPTMLSNEGTPYAIRPKVLLTDFCGEYKEIF